MTINEEIKREEHYIRMVNYVFVSFILSIITTMFIIIPLDLLLGYFNPNFHIDISFSTTILFYLSLFFVTGLKIGFIENKVTNTDTYKPLKIWQEFK